MSEFLIVLDDIASIVNFAIIIGVVVALFFAFLTYQLIKKKRIYKVLFSVIVLLLLLFLAVGLVLKIIGSL
jgi:cell division protein FtsW (lipid II flippase)